MMWEEFDSYAYGESSDGVQYGINILLENCFQICSSIDACIGIKWTVDNRCWLQTWAFYSEPSSCGDALVYRKEFVNNSIPAPTKKSCACDEVTCPLITQCFNDKLNLPVNLATGGASKHCEQARNYMGTISELRIAKKICDTALEECSSVWPTCYLNMTLSWEQGLLHHMENQSDANTDQGSLLLQRSGRGLASQKTPMQPQRLRLPNASEMITFDASPQNGKLEFVELLTMLKNDAWFATDGPSEVALGTLFQKFDKDSDNALCCMNPQSDELKAFVEQSELKEFCFTCVTGQSVAGLLLTQGGSEMDKSGREDDLDHAVSNVDKLGLEELDHIYQRKGRCR